uniref:DUF6636 domain-containing protein n=1 Tax=Ornithinimicrobium cryptoxanthini TaxID=2934161 RepID=UPI0021184507
PADANSVLPDTSTAQEAFFMPSGNVACGLGEQWVACQILEREYAPSPVVTGCTASDADTLLLRASQTPLWICSGQDMFSTARDLGATTLDYGRTHRNASFSCLSDTGGVECSNREGHSFRLARGSYDVESTDPADANSVLPDTSTAQEAFFMPSGNVACGLGEQWVACQILEREYAPSPVVTGCTASDADTLLLRASQTPLWICSGQDMFSTARNLGATTLDYGRTHRNASFSCLSDTGGVECSNREGHRFRLARGSYDVS